MGEAATVIYPVLREILTRHAQMHNPTACLSEEFVRTAFEIVPAGNLVLRLICQAAMPEVLKRREGKFAKLIEEVDGFAAETWRVFMASRGDMNLLVPLGRSQKDRIKKDVMV
jgi:hypothetical protein